MNYLEAKNFNAINDIIRMMKTNCDWLIIEPCVARAFNEEMSSYREIVGDFKDIVGLERIIIRTKYFKNITKESTEDNIPLYYNCVLEDEIRNFTTVCNYNNRFNNCITGLGMDMENSNTVILNEDVKTDVTMQNILALKATDGVIYYKKFVNNRLYFMTLFNGIIPVNKSDGLLLTIYDLPERNQFLAKFTVVKKKIKLDVFIRFVHLV